MATVDCTCTGFGFLRCSANVAHWNARLDWIGGAYWIAAIGDWIVNNTDNHHNDQVGDISISQGPYILDMYPQIITVIDTAN